jgi:hypothetical protein
MPVNQDAEASELEIVRRRDAAIFRALTTPARHQSTDPRPQSPKGEAQRQRRERERATKSNGSNRP